MNRIGEVCSPEACFGFADALGCYPAGTATFALGFAPEVQAIGKWKQPEAAVAILAASTPPRKTKHILSPGMSSTDETLSLAFSSPFTSISPSYRSRLYDSDRILAPEYVARSEEVSKLRLRRFELAVERWKRCDRRSLLYDRFLRWRRLVRRNVALRDVAASTQRRWQRCALLKSYGGWRAKTRYKLRLQLSSFLVLRSVRRAPLLHRWVLAAQNVRVVRHVRAASLRPLFAHWWDCCARLRRALTRCARKRDARLAEFALFCWRSMVADSVYVRHLLHDIWVAWSRASEIRSLGVAMAERLYSICSLRVTRDYFKHWLDFYFNLQARMKFSIGEGFKRQQRNHLCRWRLFVSFVNSNRELRAIALQHHLKRSWVEWRYSLRILRRDNKKVLEISMRHFRSQIRRRCLGAWVVYRNLWREPCRIAHLAQLRSTAVAFRIWSIDIRLKAFVKPLTSRSNKHVLGEWHHYTVQRRRRKDIGAKARSCFHRVRACQALHTWNAVTHTVCRHREVSYLSSRHWASMRSQESMLTWHKFALQRRVHIQLEQLARLCITVKRRRAAVHRWHVEASRNRHRKHIEQRAVCFRASSMRSSAVKLWHRFADSSSHKRCLFGTAATFNRTAQRQIYFLVWSHTILRSKSMLLALESTMRNRNRSITVYCFKGWLDTLKWRKYTMAWLETTSSAQDARVLRGCLEALHLLSAWRKEQLAYIDLKVQRHDAANVMDNLQMWMNYVRHSRRIAEMTRIVVGRQRCVSGKLCLERWNGMVTWQKRKRLMTDRALKLWKSRLARLCLHCWLSIALDEASRFAQRADTFLVVSRSRNTFRALLLYKARRLMTRRRLHSFWKSWRCFTIWSTRCAEWLRSCIATHCSNVLYDVLFAWKTVVSQRCFARRAAETVRRQANTRSQRSCTKQWLRMARWRLRLPYVMERRVTRSLQESLSHWKATFTATHEHRTFAAVQGWAIQSQWEESAAQFCFKHWHHYAQRKLRLDHRRIGALQKRTIASKGAAVRYWYSFSTRCWTYRDLSDQTRAKKRQVQLRRSVLEWRCRCHWRQCVRQASVRASVCAAERAIAILCIALQRWSDRTAWHQKTRRVDLIMRQWKRRRKLANSVDSWHSSAAWSQFKRHNLLICLRRIVSVLLHAVWKAWRDFLVWCQQTKQATLQTCFIRWREVGECQQRERRLEQTADFLRTTSLELWVMDSWRWIVKWKRWAEQVTQNALTHRSSKDALEVIQMWIEYVKQHNEEARAACLRWAQFWRDAKRIVALRKWQRTVIPWRRKKAALQEVRFHFESCHRQQFLRQWHSWRLVRARRARLTTRVRMNSHSKKIHVALGSWLCIIRSRRYARQAMQVASRYHKQQRVKHCVDRLANLTVGERIKRLNFTRHVQRRTLLLNSVIWKSWRSAICWMRKKRRCIEIGLKTKWWKLMQASIAGFLLHRVRQKQHRVALLQRISLLRQRAVVRWRSYRLGVCNARALIDVAMKLGRRGCIKHCFYEWLQGYRRQQKEHRISRSATQLRIRCLGMWIVDLWHAVAMCQQRERRLSQVAATLHVRYIEKWILDFWRAAAMCQQRERRLSQSAANLHIRYLEIWIVDLWRVAAIWTRWSRHAVHTGRKKLLLKYLAYVFQTWYDLVTRTRCRKQVAHQTKLKWSSCLTVSKCRFTLKTWRINGAQLACELKMMETARAFKMKTVYSRGLSCFRNNLLDKRSRHNMEVQASFLKTSFLKVSAMHSWIAFVEARRNERLLLNRASIFNARCLFVCSVLIWRIVALESRLSSRRAVFRARSSFVAWYSWTCAQTSTKHRILAVRKCLQKRHAVRTWASWQHHRARRRDLQVVALSFCASARRRAVMIWWSISHQVALCERRMLTLRATWCQWRKYAKHSQTSRSYMTNILATAVSHNMRRLLLAHFRHWNWVVEWTAANLEATVQLIRELQRARQTQACLRRQSAGPNEEELFMMRASYVGWHLYVAMQSKIQRQLSQEYCNRNHAMLLLVMDHWVDGSLVASRSENLRRRRHVRFSFDSTAIHKTRSTSLPSRGPNYSAVGGIAGGLGQWASSAALSESLELVLSPQKEIVSRLASPIHLRAQVAGVIDVSGGRIPRLPLSPAMRCEARSITVECSKRLEQCADFRQQENSHRKLNLADTGIAISPASFAGSTNTTPQKNADSLRLKVPDFPMALSPPKTGLHGALSSQAKRETQSGESDGKGQATIDTGGPAVRVDTCQKLDEKPRDTRRSEADACVDDSNRKYLMPRSQKDELPKTPDILRFFKVRGCAGA